MTSQTPAKPKKSRSSVYLLKVRVDSTSPEKLLKTVVHIVSRPTYNTLFTIFTPNPEQVFLAQANDHFRSILNQSSLNLPDGMGLVWADRWLSRRTGQLATLKQRITGVDSMQALVGALCEQRVPFFLLGGKPASAKQAAHSLITDHVQSGGSMRLEAAQQLVAWDAGSSPLASETEADRLNLFQKIKEHGTKVLFVAYGAPQQEAWVMAHRDQLVAAGVRVALVVGGAFEVLAGNVSRAPVKWQNSGLEWLWRLVLEPWRWRRQMSLIKFILLVAQQALLTKARQE